MQQTPNHAIIAADITRGDVLVHFSNGESVLFRAAFLWGSRQQDSNVGLPATVDGEEPLIIPDAPE